MAADEAGEYSITWESKPLGFSIVMDTTGRNAYVSSIQKPDNLEKGLKLAAQIIKINGQDVKQKKHSEILETIRSATLPMELTFQPRSFANDPKGDENTSTEKKHPKGLLFAGAPEAARDRVEGLFELVADQNHNGRPMWMRKDNIQDDPIILWWFPKEKSGLNTSLWMIGRQKKMDTDKAYACVATEEEYLLDINKFWKVYDMNVGKYKDCKLRIHAEVDSNESSK